LLLALLPFTSPAQNPVITQQPQSQTVNIGGSATFTVSVSSGTPVAYQWRYNGGSISGATTSSYGLANVQPNQAGAYSVACTNATGFAISTNATLTVNSPNLVPGQPPGWNDKIVTSRGTGTTTNDPVLTTTNIIYVDIAIQNTGTASSGAPFTNELYLDNVLQATFTVGSSVLSGFYATYQDYPLGPLNAGTHTLRIKVDSANNVVESNESDNEYSKAINVTGPVTITNQPLSQTATQGVAVIFSVGASGVPPLVYQWNYNGSPITDATDSSYSILNVQYRQGGSYSVLITNAQGSITSSNAVLTVVLPPGTVAGWGDDSSGQSTVPNTLNGVRAIAAGASHSVAVRTNGTVICWGDNSYDQTNVPAGLSNVISVSAGYYHSLALCGDGTLVGWGDNGYGETNVPAGLSNVIAISCGALHNLALQGDGTVVAWGYDFEGESDVPPGLSNVVAIAAGELFSLALKNDGTIVGWGTNGSGQLDPPAGLTGVVALAGGDSFSMALKNNGTVVAWGDNTGGQTNVPAGLSNVIAIAAGSFDAVALKADGTVVQWGYDGPISPPGLTNMVAISAKVYHSLALKGNGSVVISQQPLGQKVNQGANATFVVMAAGNAPLKYQWRFNGTNLAGATKSSFTRTNAQPISAGIYSVNVTNAFGAVLSSNATLTLNLPLTLTAGGFVSNGFQLTVSGPPFISVIVDAATNLAAPINWTAIYTNNTGAGGSFNFSDTTAPGHAQSFYRGRE
jgi:hypothetical protein